MSETDNKLADAIGLVYAALSGDAADVFAELCRDDGLLVRCEACGWDNPRGQAACEECKAGLAGGDDDGPVCRGCDKPFTPPWKDSEHCSDCLYRRADWLRDREKNTFSGP